MTNTSELTATVVAILAALAAITLPVAIVSHHSTERLTSCVESGGAYVNVPNTSRMECQR